MHRVLHRALYYAPIGKIELQSLKAVLASGKISFPVHLSRILSEINLNLTFQSILVHRHVNELFLFVSPGQPLDLVAFLFI
jgi:hypothetical protein